MRERMLIKIVCRDHSMGLESRYGNGDNLLSRNSLEGRREVEMEDKHIRSREGRASGFLSFSGLSEIP